jgi:hypothetical protein
MPTPNTPPERTRKTEARTGPGDVHTPTKEEILREQQLSTERQLQGHGWASQSTEERRGEPAPEPPRMEPGEGERVPVRNTARLAEEGQRIARKDERAP